MKEEIVLDGRSFKALSADSRINILKNLKERRQTLSELSQKLNLGSSTVKEHCEILINANLIRQVDEGRKWKYYELTQKGKQIISPNIFEEVKVLIVLCLGVFLLGGAIFLAIQIIQFNYETSSLNSAQSKADYPSIKDYSTIIGESMDQNRSLPQNQSQHNPNGSEKVGINTNPIDSNTQQALDNNTNDYP